MKLAHNPASIRSNPLLDNGREPDLSVVLSRTDVTSAIDGEINLILGYRMNVAFSV